MGHAILGRTKGGDDYVGDYVQRDGVWESGRGVPPEDIRRYQRALDASIKRADAKLRWHKRVGHSGAARRRRSTRPRWTGRAR